MKKLDDELFYAQNAAPAPKRRHSSEGESVARKVAHIDAGDVEGELVKASELSAEGADWESGLERDLHTARDNSETEEERALDDGSQQEPLGTGECWIFLVRLGQLECPRLTHL